MSTTNKFKLLKQIPQSVKDCAYGYCHKFETSIKCTIPILIQSLCLLYYYETDYFQCAASEQYEISNDKMMVLSSSDPVYWGRVLMLWEKWAFLNNWVPSMSHKIFKWLFKVQRKPCANDEKLGGGIAFALISNDHGVKHFYSTDTDGIYIHYNSGNTIKNWKKIQRDELNDYMKFGRSNDQIDHVLYTLDLKQNVWKCKVNDNDEWIISGVEVSEGIKYKMILAMNYRKDKITLQQSSWSFWCILAHPFLQRHLEKMPYILTFIIV